ncbi:MAG: hypothetical protein ACON4Z_03885, partial [Planctomycetota bacterium]
MTLPLAIVAGLTLAAAGLVAARSAPIAARWLGFVAALAFAVVALVADGTSALAVPARVQAVSLEGDAAARRT